MTKPADGGRIRVRRHKRRSRLLVGLLGLAIVPLIPTLSAVPAAAFTVKAISLNTANWSGSAGFGSTTPGWYKDSSGIVHFQGAATQTSRSGTSPDLIGTLPTGARPTRDVFTIVHTFNGTYADLAIAPSGQVSIIPPRPPAVEDFTFVSLEGVTYQL